MGGDHLYHHRPAVPQLALGEYRGVDAGGIEDDAPGSGDSLVHVFPCHLLLLLSLGDGQPLLVQKVLQRLLERGIAQNLASAFQEQCPGQIQQHDQAQQDENPLLRGECEQNQRRAESAPQDAGRTVVGMPQHIVV